MVAEEQTAGRGRLGRRWQVPPGTSLLCSILFRPQLTPAQAPRLTMLCSLAAADAVKKVAGMDVGIKWPNDLVVESDGWRKLAGVLTETGMAGRQVDYVVVGIGLNVNVTREELTRLAPNATSLLAEAGREVDRNLLLAGLLAGIEERYGRMEEGEGPHGEWSRRLVTLGRRVEVTGGGGRIAGLAEGVDEDGALLLRTADGTLHRLLAGDVTLAPAG